MTLTPERLAEIGKLAETATPGPWGIKDPAFPSTGRVLISANVVEGQEERNGGQYVAHAIGPECAANAAFIAALDPATVLSLIAGCQGEVTVTEALTQQCAEAIFRAWRDHMDEMGESGFGPQNWADLSESERKFSLVTTRACLTAALAKKE